MANREVTDKLLNDAIKIMSKQFGAGYDARGLADAKYKAVSTGHDDLDAVLTKGANGLYLGGIIEISGPESAGKTSVALRTCGYAQRGGGRCCWFDAEATFDPTLAMINGCDPTRLVMSDLSDTRAVDSEGDSLGFFNVSEILEMIYQSVIHNVYTFVVVDSVAGLMPESVLADNLDPNKSGISEVARAMSKFLPKIAQACKKTDTSVILINQLRDKPGEYFADRFHTPGGRAIKFFAQQRIGVEKVFGDNGKVYQYHENDKDKELIGHYAKITIIKNKKAPPLQDGVKIEIPIYYKEYFPDNAKKCYDLARKLKVITIRNGILTWKDEEEVIRQLEGESAILAKIRDEKLETRLAYHCMSAEKSERNQKLNVPVKVPVSIAELANSYQPNEEKTVVAKKRKVAAVEKL